MPRHFALIILCAFFACAVTGGTSYKTYQEALEGLSTPGAVISYMAGYFVFTYHAGCIAYAPEVFFESGQGDCKDYAVFFSYIVDHHGYYAELISFRFTRETGGGGHTVTIFRDTDGLLWYQSNDAKYGPVVSIDDVLDHEKIRLNATAITNYAVFPPGTLGLCVAG